MQFAPQAVELAPGNAPGQNAFLIDPVQIPPGLSLIIDGGVTVYASRNRQNYQNLQEPRTKCGTVHKGYPVYGGCLPLFTLTSNSGIYGRGVIDGQGQRPMIDRDQLSTTTWWSLLDDKEGGCTEPADASSDTCEQAAPPLISAGVFEGETARATGLTLYKITLRNPPFHTVRIGGTSMTIWGVNVQAPWNVPNSDGFDVSGQDILFHDVVVANGDQDIAITSPSKIATNHMTIEGLTAYGKGGVALLGGEVGATDIMITDMAMTGDVASFASKLSPNPLAPTVLINGIDPTAATLPGTDHHLVSYGQALPSATGDLNALQINFNVSGKGDSNTIFRNIVFNRICLQDIVRPIHIGGLESSPPQTAPTVEGVRFQNLHVLQPTAQYPHMDRGVVTGPRGTYQATFVSAPTHKDYNHITFENVVFDDEAAPVGGPSLATLEATGNWLTTEQNVYPQALNDWTAPANERPYPGWSLSDNHYRSSTPIADPELAWACPASLWPYVRGELYTTIGPSKGQFTLNAIVQPAMSQTTYYRKGAYGAKPGLLAIGAPPLTAQIEFYERTPASNTWIDLGHAPLGANGTLATLTVPMPQGEPRYFTAVYPGDAYYKRIQFGNVMPGH